MAPILGKLTNRQGLNGPLLDDSTWLDRVDSPPPVPPMNMAALKPLVLPETPRPQVTTPLLQRVLAVNQDLAQRMAPKPAATGVLGKIGHTAANIGNVLGSIFPGIAAGIKGSDVYNERMMARDKEDLDQISQLNTENAQRAQTEATTEYQKQRPAIEQSKIDQRQQAIRDRVAQQAAAHGQKVTWDDQGNPSYEDDPQLLAHAAQSAQIELRDAQAELARSKNDPNSPAYQQAERRVKIAQANAQAAQIRAGAYEGNYLMHALGTDRGGAALPGAQVLDGTPVGTSLQGNVTKSLTGNAQFDDVQQGIEHTGNALTALHETGGSLNSPAMITALGHSSSGLGKWLQSQAAASLTPQERDAVVAVNAMRERILAMRKASGGTASESQVKRMIDMLPGPQTPDLDTAQRQLREVQSQLDTLRPGVPQINRPGKQEPKPAASNNVIIVKPEDLK